MPISGYVASGAQDALEQVLDRRLKEAIRQQQEKQHAEQTEMERQRMQMQQNEATARQQERIDDQKYRQGQTDRADAELLYKGLTPGNISRQSAMGLKKHPGLAPYVSERQVIDAAPRQVPLPGGTSFQLPALKADESQRFNLAPNDVQAKEAKRVIDLQRVNERLGAAKTQEAKIAAAAEAIGAGLPAPPGYMVEATEAQKQETAEKARAAERVAQFEQWKKQHAIEVGDRQPQAQIPVMRDGKPVYITPGTARPGDTPYDAATIREKPDPQKAADLRSEILDAAKTLRDSPGLADFTGAPSRAYGYGVLKEPYKGTPAATTAEFYNRLRALVTLPNLGLMKGVLSESDMKMLVSAATSLSPNMDDPTFVATLQKIIDKFEGKTAEVGASDTGKPLAPNTTVTIGGDDLAEINRRRALKKPPQ